MMNVETLAIYVNKLLHISHINFQLYLMKKFPNLRNLDLWMSGQDWRITNTDLFSTIAIRSTSPINQFFQYLSRLSDFTVKYVEVDTVHLCELFKQFFDNFAAIKKIQTNFTLTNQEEDRFGEQEESVAVIELLRDMDESKIEVTIQLYTKRYGSICWELLEKFGNHFDNLTLDIDHKSDTTILLNYISTFCTQLKTLFIKGNNYVGTVDSSFVYRNDLKTLALSHDFTPKLLSSISSHFPNVKNLVVNHYLSKEESERDANYRIVCTNHGIIKIDLMNVSLKHLMIDFSVGDRFYEERLKNVYIKVFTHIDNQTRYFCVQAPPDPEDTPKERLLLKLAENPTDIDYQASVDNIRYLHHDIICNSVGTVTVVEHPYDFDGLLAVDDLTLDICIFNN